MRRSATNAALLFAVVAVALANVPAQADITLKERVSLQASGLMSFANMDGYTTTTISGQRARTDSEIQMKSRAMRMFGGDAATAEIVRLDEDKLYQLELKKKRYTETTFAEQRARLEKLLAQQKEAQAQQQQASSGVDESDCEWLPPKVEVKRTGERSTIAGFDAERVTVTAVQSCKVKNTANVCDFALAFDQWVAPEFEGDSEVLAYQKAYAEKMGMNAAASRDFAERAEALFGRYEDMWRELGTKLRDVQGYPVKSTIGFGMGGPQCQNAKQAQTAESSSPLGGSLAGQLGGAIGGLLKKSKPAKPTPAVAATTLPNGLTPVMTLTSELIAVSRDPVSAATFEVPGDFQKVENLD
jgi:hypothetical protein